MALSQTKYELASKAPSDELVYNLNGESMSLSTALKKIGDSYFIVVRVRSENDAAEIASIVRSSTSRENVVVIIEGLRRSKSGANDFVKELLKHPKLSLPEQNFLYN